MTQKKKKKKKPGGDVCLNKTKEELRTEGQIKLPASCYMCWCVNMLSVLGMLTLTCALYTFTAVLLTSGLASTFPERSLPQISLSISMLIFRFSALPGTV